MFSSWEKLSHQNRHGIYTDVKFNILDGHFTVTFTGPDMSLSRLRPIQPRVVYEVAPGKLDRLKTGQKKIIQRLLERGQVNVPQMAKLLNVTPQAVRKEMAKLQHFGLIVQKGKARATHYVLKEE